MRLTLRTLLAYLDNTLEPQDAEVLRSKIAESGFASQLTQRIRNTLSLSTLGAPSPDAVGPVEEANMIGEYLDSTLPVEQVAEIERACLESDALLAEAAGCHQILTLVLGKPAEVSPGLRERVYELPRSQSAAQGLETAESYASLAIPEDAETRSGGPVDASFAAAGAPGVLPVPPGPMRPVGLGDSGVSDAPTRLREAGVVGDPAGAGAAAIAGSRHRSAEFNEMYGGTVRTSRITPWLVSLALAGVLLFALAQIFEPLINRRTASRDDDRVDYAAATVPDGEKTTVPAEGAAAPGARDIEVAPNASPLMAPVGEPVVDGGVADDSAASLPAPRARAAEERPEVKTRAEVRSEPPVPLSETLVAPAPLESPRAKPTVVPPPPLPQGATAPAPATGALATSQPGETATPGAEPADADDKDAAETSPTPATAPPTVREVEPAEPMRSERSAEPEPPMSDDLTAPATGGDRAAIATLQSDRTLVLMRGENQDWQRVPAGGEITAGAEILCAPSFRANLETPAGLKITMVGPTELRLTHEGEPLALELATGQLLLQHSAPQQPLELLLSGRPVSIALADASSVIAVELSHRRSPGADPLVESSRVREATLLMVQGAAEVTSGEAEATLETGQVWQLTGKSDPTLATATEIPAWIDEPDAKDSSLASIARDGLLALITEEQPVELSLREAIPFRRAEVGALAARTLLRMGRGDVYFGGDGILNQPRQRAYWEDHYRTLLAVTDQSVESALELRDSIARMEAADRERLFELLVGYSQKQLAAGADAKLVSLLNSSSMAVRVLALQNLWRITGTTLNYRADQENAIRRASDIKKWEVRVRKGDIRWSDGEAAALAEVDQEDASREVVEEVPVADAPVSDESEPDEDSEER